jgi:hypothetical protein
MVNRRFRSKIAYGFELVDGRATVSATDGLNRKFTAISRTLFWQFVGELSSMQ